MGKGREAASVRQSRAVRGRAGLAAAAPGMLERPGMLPRDEEVLIGAVLRGLSKRDPH